MTETLLRRNAAAAIKETLADTPVTVIQGARQVGKSTLARIIANSMNSRQVTLDSNETLAAAKENPIEFVSQFKEGLLVIDEIQRCPELLNAIKLSVDRNRKPGKFLITGSANLLNLKGAHESLAGRAETITLEPLSVGELNGVKEDFVAGLLNIAPLDALRRAAPLARSDYANLVSNGGYPDALTREGRRRSAYFRNYLSRVLDHDADDLFGLSHLDRLKKLHAVVMGETSKLYVKAHVSRLVDIPESSMNGYIRLLLDLCLVRSLPAWGKNYSRRAVAKPKLVVNDTGLACSQSGIDRDFLANIENGNELGPLLETFAIMELAKQQTWSAAEYSLHHFRDRDGKEVDLVLELLGGRIIAIEIKAASSFSRKDFSGLKMLRDMLGERFICGLVLYTGVEVQPFGEKLFAAPLSSLWS
jgi:predicted AAA+ superfamily ATPase